MVGVGLGMTVLHLAITFIMWAAVAINRFSQAPDFSPNTLQFLQGMHGGIAWALLVLAGVMLCQARPVRSRHVKASASAGGEQPPRQPLQRPEGL